MNRKSHFKRTRKTKDVRTREQIAAVHWGEGHEGQEVAHIILSRVHLTNLYLLYLHLRKGRNRRLIVVWYFHRQTFSIVIWTTRSIETYLN
jgi:hypothetical protein